MVKKARNKISLLQTKKNRSFVMSHPLLRRNRNRQINASIRRQARRDARHRRSIAVIEAANLLVHGILGATEDQYDAVMDVQLDDTNLDLDNNFQDPVDDTGDPRKKEIEGSHMTQVTAGGFSCGRASVSQ